MSTESPSDLTKSCHTRWAYRYCSFAHQRKLSAVLIIAQYALKTFSRCAQQSFNAFFANLAVKHWTPTFRQCELPAFNQEISDKTKLRRFKHNHVIKRRKQLLHDNRSGFILVNSKHQLQTIYLGCQKLFSTIIPSSLFRNLKAAYTVVVWKLTNYQIFNIWAHSGYD